MVVDEFCKISPNTWTGHGGGGGGDNFYFFPFKYSKSIVDYSDRFVQVFPSVVDYLFSGEGS